MKKTYINGLASISAQPTFDSEFLENAMLNENENRLALVAPPYKDYIAPAAARRMAKGVKNGIVASALALKEAGLEMPDAIITGTGMGCIEDSDKFLTAILDNNEQFLTPTSFIQSTHNTVGAQIALGLQCKAYNFTYVNAAVSFESAVLDAKMQLETDEAKSVLVGGIDEMTDYTERLFKLAGFIKKDGEAPYQVLGSQTDGAIFGEGATFFVLENERKANSYAEIVDLDMVNMLDLTDLLPKVKNFLSQNQLEIKDLDAVILGYNGDQRYDVYYKELAEQLSGIPQVYYKHLSGEYNTASAFGLYVGAKIVRMQQIPEIIQANKATKPNYKNVLLYNQYKGIDHSFILIRQC